MDLLWREKLSPVTITNSRTTKNNMKKLTLTIVCALAVTGAAFAQGNVNRSVISPACMTAQTNSTQVPSLDDWEKEWGKKFTTQCAAKVAAGEFQANGYYYFAVELIRCIRHSR
jgi:hypothetical protein